MWSARSAPNAPIRYPETTGGDPAVPEQIELLEEIAAEVVLVPERPVPGALVREEADDTP